MSSIFRYREQNGRTYHAYEDKTGTQDSGEYVGMYTALPSKLKV